MRGHALSTPFGALKHLHIPTTEGMDFEGACPLNALRGTETFPEKFLQGVTSQGACPLNTLRGTETPLKTTAYHGSNSGGACPLNALRGTETRYPGFS